MNLNKPNQRQGGFTLMETVISIGLLAVLLSAFMVAFTPAVQGIKRALSAEEADRLAYTLERELVTLREGESSNYTTGFDKAYQWIEGTLDPAVLIYQYRADPNSSPRSDGSLDIYNESGGVAGQDFIVQTIVRRTDDSTFLEDDLKAVEGRVYTAKLHQLVYSGGELVRGTIGEITDPTPDDGDPPGSDSATYPEAVITFAADFFVLPNSSYDYVRDRFDIAELNKPIFTRNLAVRR